jgi:capsular polysaccharide biosynthesis protein
MSDGQQTVAIIAGNSLVPGPSFHRPRWITPAPPPQENPMLKWGRVPGTLRHVRGTSLSLLSDLDGGTNYYHWMVDVLPRLHLAAKAGFPQTNIDFYVIPDNSLHYQTETIDLMKIAPNARISAKTTPHIAADTLVVTTHPCPDLYNVPPWIVSWLREAFLGYSSERKFGCLVYVDRSDAPRRRLFNGDECYSLVLQPLGFERHQLSEMSFTDQVRLFSGADVIVGSHGAGFVNLAFCRRGTKVLELFGAWQVPVFKAISRARGLQYSALVGANHRTDVEPKSASFSVNLQEVASALNLLRV